METGERQPIWVLNCLDTGVVGVFSNEKKALYQLNVCIQAENSCRHLFPQAENDTPIFKFYDNMGDFVCTETNLDLTTSEKVEKLEENLVAHHIRNVKIQRGKRNYEFELTCRYLQ